MYWVKGINPFKIIAPVAAPQPIGFTQEVLAITGNGIIDTVVVASGDSQPPAFEVTLTW